MRDQVGNLSGNIGATCLHLGRRGQGCSRPALEDGFCESHGPGAESPNKRIATRRLIAVILGISALWPLFAEFWRAINHLRNPGHPGH